MQFNTKKCAICKETKDESCFGVYRCMPDGLNWACKDCAKTRRKGYYRVNRDKEIARSTKYKANNRDKVKNTILLRKYGITLEEYLCILKQQNFCCAICKNHEDSFEDRLVVDHDHSTNRVRALLCHGCNLALGSIKENVATAQNLVEFLIKYKS